MAMDYRQGMQLRTQLLLGEEKMEKIRSAKVLIFGTGGVGSWCAEGLVRSGISHLTLVDSDVVCMSNCNRQLMATSATLGQSKVEMLKKRLLEINPEAEIEALQMVYNAETAESFHMKDYDYIVDAIDSLKDKIDLILRATALPERTTFISSMGAALRCDPTKIRTTEFWKVKGDPLAHALRKRFRHLGTFPSRKFQCVYSEELPMENRGTLATAATDEQNAKSVINGSLCHVTSVYGMTIASRILNSM